MKPTLNLHQSLLAVSCALALSLGAAHAADVAKTLHERGTIKSVDSQTHTILLTASKGNTEHKFQWNDQTKFTAGSEASSAAKLKEGQAVSVTYTPGGDAPILQHVRLAPKEPKHAAVSPASHYHAS